MAITSSQSASVNSAAGARRWMPALLTRILTCPKWASVLSRTSSGALLSARSAEITSSRLPVAETRSLSSGASAERCTETISAPASASAAAMLSPSPRLLPVTTATFPSRRKRSRIVAILKRFFLAIIGRQYLIRHAAGAGGSLTRARTVPLAIEFVHDALDQRLLDVGRGRNVDVLHPLRSRQVKQFPGKRRKLDFAFGPDDFSVIEFLEVGEKPLPYARYTRLELKTGGYAVFGRVIASAVRHDAVD